MSIDETTDPPLPGRNILLLPASVAARLLVARFIAEANGAYGRMDGASARGADASTADASAEETALHDFRVAWRRLRTTTRFYRPQLRKVISKSTREALRDIADISGESRDIEVYLHWLAARQPDDPREQQAHLWLTEVFTSRRNVANPGGVRQALGGFPQVRDALASALAREEKRKTARDLTAFAVVVGATLSDATKELDKLLRRVNSIADHDRAHRSRIAGKRLRYVLEPLAEAEPDATKLVEKLKHLQDDVGEMRDANLFRSQIELFLDAESTVVADPGLREGLAAVAAQLHSDESRAYHRMRSRWSRKASKSFFARARDFARTVTTMGALADKNVEIEHKFLLKALPKRAKNARFIEIEQGWLPGEKFAERLRRAHSGGRSKYFRTVKLGAGVRRIELEERTTRAIFEIMWPLTEGKRISKRRYVVRDSGLDWEIDVFADRDLVLAEVELDDVGFPPRIPRWLRPYVVREVTDEPEYVNRNLAR